MSCTYKERMFNLPATQQTKGPMPASSPVAASSSSSSSSSQPPLTNGGPSQIRLPPKKDFRSESEQQQLQQIQKVSPFPNPSTQSQAIRNADSPLDLSVKTRKRCADTTIFDYFIGGMSPLKRTKVATTGVPPIPLDLTKTKTSPMKQMVPPVAGMMSPAYATTNPYAYKTMTPKASSSSATPSKPKPVKPSKGKEFHNTIRSLPPDSVSRITVGQPQQTASSRQKLTGGYISFPSMFAPQPTAVGSAGLSPSSLMNKSQAGHGGDSRVSGSHPQISHGLREVSADSVKSSSQRGLTLFEQQQQQHGQSTSRAHHIQQQQQQQYQYSQQRQLHHSQQQQHYQSTRQMHTTASQRVQHTSQRPSPIQQQSTSSQRPTPQPPPPHCQPNPRLREHDLVTQQHRLQQQQRLQQHYMQQQQQRQQSPIHPTSSSSSLTSPITISSPPSPSVTVLSSTPSSSSSSTSLAVSASSSSSSTTSASSSRLLPVSVSSTYSEISASGAGMSAKVFPFHQLEQSSKKYDNLPSSHKMHPNGNATMIGEGMISNSGSVEITSSGMNRYSPDSTDCTISGVTKRVPLASDLHSQQRHLHQSYQDQQQLSAQMYAGISLDKLANSANNKTPPSYKTMQMSPYHQQQLYMPVAMQKLSPADSQKKHSQIIGNNSMSGSSKPVSILSESPSNKTYHSAYHYQQQQQRHILMTANKYDGIPGPVSSGPHHVASPPSSYSSPIPATTSSSSSSMVSVQNIQKQKQPPQSLHYNSISMKSPSRSSVELLKISNDSNDDVKIIGSTPGPGSSMSSNTSSRSMKEVPVINIISDGHESPSLGRGPAKSQIAAGNGPAMSGRGVHVANDYHPGTQQGVESAKRFTTPLSINIPSESLSESSTSGTTGSVGKSDPVSGKSSLTESRDPKLGSRKHIIMNAVNQDEALKKVFHVENGSGAGLNPHEESLSETSFNSISPAPSPKMPILSPQHKNPPRMGTPSTSDPPPLEPSPATFLENPSPVSFVQENLSNNDQIVRPNLEIKRVPTNTAPQRPKPPIAYLSEPVCRGQFPSSVFGPHMPYLSAFNAPMYMHMISAADHTVHSAASAAATATRIPESSGNTGSGVPPAGMAGTNSGKVVMDSLREKREGFNVRSTARNKNIPVANVAPIVQVKHYRQNTTTSSSSSSTSSSSSSSSGNANNNNSNISSNLGLPLNATSSNSNHSNSSDEVKIISASNDGPCRSSGVGEKGKPKSGTNVTGAGGGGDGSAGGGGLKEASGKVSPTMPRTFFSPHNIISMFKNSKNEKILESMCCDKNAQRGKMSLKDAINTLLEKHCKELHVETDQGEGSPSCLSSSSRSSDVEIIENPFERDNDPLISDRSNSTTTTNTNNNLSTSANRHPLFQRNSNTTTNTTNTITTTITNTTTFGTIVSSAINSVTLAASNRPMIHHNDRLPGSFTSKKQHSTQNSQMLLQSQNHDDEDVIALSVEADPNYKTNTSSNDNGSTNNKSRLSNIQTDAHMNRLKQKLLRSVPVDIRSSAEDPSVCYKKYISKNGNGASDVSGVNCANERGRSGCNFVNDEHHSKTPGKADETTVVDLCQSPIKTITDIRERIPDNYSGVDGHRLGSQHTQPCQDKKSLTTDNTMVKDQARTEQNLEDIFNQTRGKDKYLSEKRKTSGRRLAEVLKRKAVLRAVVYRKTLYQEFNERIRIGRTHKDGESRIIMTRSSTRRRSSQRTHRTSLRPRAARPQRGALVEKDSEEEESLPGCWEIERSSPSLRLRRRRGGAIPANNSSNSISNINDSTSGLGGINNSTSNNKKRLMMTLHWRPRRGTQNFCVAGRRNYRVVTRYSSRSKRNMFGSYKRQTLDWAEVRQLPVPPRKNLPCTSTRRNMEDPDELRDEETESVLAISKTSLSTKKLLMTRGLSTSAQKMGLHKNTRTVTQSAGKNDGNDRRIAQSKRCVANTTNMKEFSCLNRWVNFKRCYHQDIKCKRSKKTKEIFHKMSLVSCFKALTAFAVVGTIYELASNSNSVCGTIPIPPEIRRIAINKNSGETLLHRSARCGYEDVLLHCLETKSVDVNARDNAGFTPLHECCVRGNLLIARYLITYGADVNQCSQDGIRPIHDAVENDHIEMARLLLSFGADPLLTTYSGKSPIKIARSGRMINLLKDHISDLNGDDSHEITPWEFNGSWNIKENDTNNGNPIFEDIPSDQETDESDTNDFVFDDCPLTTFSLGPNTDKKYITLLDIVQYTGEKLDKIRRICQANISTMKFEEFVNDTKGLVCLENTMSRITAKKGDFVELVESDEYDNIMGILSGIPCNTTKKTPSRGLTSTTTNSKVGIKNSDKPINGREGALESVFPLSPVSVSDEEVSALDEANSIYFEKSSDLPSFQAKENTALSGGRNFKVSATSATKTKTEPVNTSEKSHPIKLRDDADDYHESPAETSVPTLSFKERFIGGQTRTTKKKRVAIDSVFPGPKSAATTAAGTATSMRHNGHFTIKMGNLPDDYYQTFGIDQAGGVSDHSAKSPRKMAKDPPQSYSENLDCGKKNQIPTDSSVVIDR